MTAVIPTPPAQPARASTSRVSPVLVRAGLFWATWLALVVFLMTMRAIYLAWNFQYTGTTDAEKDAVLGKAMNWLAPSATWIQAVPATGTVPEQADQAVAVTLNSADPQITQPGTYQGELKMSNNTPGMGMISVPVTFVVNPPATWGKLQGTVQGLGYCDADPASLADALVVVTYDSTTVNLKTDANGYYSYWFDAAASPLSISVTAAGHEAGAATATIAGGQTTTQDFSLRWLKPCSDTDPISFNVNIALGGTLDQPLTLFNNGAAATGWEPLQAVVCHLAQPVTIPPVPASHTTAPRCRPPKALGVLKHGQVKEFTPMGPVNLVLTTAQPNSDRLQRQRLGYQFIWMNRFTPAVGRLPFNLEQISILWPSGQVTAGSSVDLVVYQDTDGDGDPSDAELMRTYNVTVQNVDGTTWDSYTLATPLLLGGPGDVLIGAINRWSTAVSRRVSGLPISIRRPARGARGSAGGTPTRPYRRPCRPTIRSAQSTLSASPATG
jgi:hypothetical protein